MNGRSKKVELQYTILEMFHYGFKTHLSLTHFIISIYSDLKIVNRLKIWSFRTICEENNAERPIGWEVRGMSEGIQVSEVHL
jgi:hypothetical protein